jgi:glutaredoxin 3
LLIDQKGDGEDIRNELGRMTGAKSMPRVFVNGNFIGGCDGSFFEF